MSIDVEALREAIATVTNGYISQEAEDIAAEYARLVPAEDEGRLREAAQAVVSGWIDDESGMATFDPELIDRLADALRKPNEDEGRLREALTATDELSENAPDYGSPRTLYSAGWHDRRQAIEAALAATPEPR